MQLPPHGPRWLLELPRHLICDQAKGKEDGHAPPQALIFKYIPLELHLLLHLHSMGQNLVIQPHLTRKYSLYFRNHVHSWSRGGWYISREEGEYRHCNLSQAMPGYVTLDKPLTFSGPQFPYIQSKRFKPDDLSPKSFSVPKFSNQ